MIDGSITHPFLYLGRDSEWIASNSMEQSASSDCYQVLRDATDLTDVDASCDA